MTEADAPAVTTRRDAAPAKVWSIAPGAPFADTLAAGLLREAGDAPLALARHQILLPTRRACRTLREAFLRQCGGTALLLPRIQPIGDVDEDELALVGGDEAIFAEHLDLPPAVPELRRRLLLAARIIERPDLSVGADQAAWLAVELARFLDQVQTERRPVEALDGLAPENLAEHWQRVLDFLRIVLERWPESLAREEALDPAARRNALLEAQAEAWRAQPPDHPVIAAGSTGSIPATADLLDVIARLPNGRVVLPGLDMHLDDAAWERAADDQTHPQFGMARLLHRMAVARDTVRAWPNAAATTAAAAPAMRARLVSEALRPADTTEAWWHLPLTRADAAAALEGVERVDCATPEEEAGVVALVLREGIETPGRTAALVTPDRELARRVAAELWRWNIDVDDSAGVPLATTPPGTFLRLSAAALAEDLAPVPLLSMLKHPLAACGRPLGALRGWARELERKALRGPRPKPGIGGLMPVLTELRAPRDLKAGLNDLEKRVKRFETLMRGEQAELPELLDAHVEAAEALAASDGETGAQRLWAGEAGEALAEFVGSTIEAAAGFPTIAPRAYPAILDALLSGRVVRPPYGRHPRLFIWGPLEARLQHADTLVMGGLNEGSWPAEVEADPWMSRPMRAAFGLPLPERRIGLSAHDFAQGFTAPRVVLTRSLRVDGVPTVPSRWLQRLDAILLRAAGANDGVHVRAALWPRRSWQAWRRALDKAEPRRIAPPAPRPPVEARPRRLSVTQIETWLRNPYAVYARHVLGLKRLDPIDAEPGAAERGLFVHAILERFVREFPGALPADAADHFRRISNEVLASARVPEGFAPFWRPRLERIGAWFLRREAARRQRVAASHIELAGALDIQTDGAPFRLTARADRVDLLRDGGAVILDYKTGSLPSQKAIDHGLAPQLPLEAAMLHARAFEEVGAEVAPDGIALEYWRLTGAQTPGDAQPVKGDIAALAEQAIGDLKNRIALFDDPATPYGAPGWSEAVYRYDDYAHLARVREWSATGAGGEEEP